MRPSYVYDIETENWTTFVVGALYDGKRVEIYDWRKEREFAKRLLSLHGEVYAHNGGRFDHLWLLDAAHRFGMARHAHVIENSTGIVSLDFGDVKFLDSFRLFPMTLRKLTNGQKHSLSDLCHCGADCGGYCAINRHMPPDVTRRVRDYLIGDVRELWQALDFFQRLAAEIGITLGLTIGGTAWQSAARELGLSEQPYGKDGIADWKFVRGSYYGGRSEIFRTESDEGWQYDVNSMYPAKIATVPLPLEYQGKRYGRSASDCFARGLPGVYRGVIHVPDCFIPPLPVRGKTRIYFPTGRIQGTWTLLDLQAAERAKCRIESISEAAVFSRSEVIFKAWVDRLFAVRAKLGKDSREGAWLKLVMNSLTGKFGAKVTHRAYILDPCFNESCKCGKKAIDPDGLNCSGNPATSRVWWREYERIQKCGHVEWSAYLTSAARITLNEALNEKSVYCDTDGFFSERIHKQNVGNALGQWQDKGRYESFIALAPKVYCYHNASDGLLTVRAKGIPNNEAGKHSGKRFWRKLIEGRPIEYWSIAGIRNPIQGMFFARRFLHRKVSQNLGGRLPGRGAITRPPAMREVDLTR